MHDPHIDRRADRIFEPANLSREDIDRFMLLGREARAKAFSGFARTGVAAVRGLVFRSRS